jgi:hypothetical protein
MMQGGSGMMGGDMQRMDCQRMQMMQDQSRATSGAANEQTKAMMEHERVLGTPELF